MSESQIYSKKWYIKNDENMKSNLCYMIFRLFLKFPYFNFYIRKYKEIISKWLILKVFVISLHLNCFHYI